MAITRSDSAALAAALAAAFLAVSPARAFWTSTGEDHRLEVGASIRTIGALYQYYDQPQLFGEGNEFDGLSQSVLRITAEGGHGNSLAFEGHLVGDLTWTSAPGVFDYASGAVGGPPAGRYRAADLSWDWLEESRWGGRYYLDRLNVKGSFGPADLTFGRQAINFSQAYFWNPLDIFLAFDPEAFDRDYKSGVDAIRLDLALGAFSGLTLVYAPGRELTVGIGYGGLEVTAVDFSDESWYGSSLVGRYRTNRWDWDFTLQGGKVYGGWQIGGGFSGDLRELGIRGELTWFEPSEDRTFDLFGIREIDLMEEHAAAVVGVDHRFDNSLHLNIEYLYNGGAGDDLYAGLLRTAVGETLSLSRHLIGADVSYEFQPLLNGHLSWIYSLSDGSHMASPTLVRSVSDESELIVGAIITFGERPESEVIGGGFEEVEIQSEFGTYPNTFFAELKYYF